MVRGDPSGLAVSDRPQRTAKLGQLQVRQPFPGFGRPATHRFSSAQTMPLVIRNVGRERAETDENLVPSRLVSLDRIREFARPYLDCAL